MNNSNNSYKQCSDNLIDTQIDDWTIAIAELKWNKYVAARADAEKWRKSWYLAIKTMATTINKAIYEQL